MESEALEKRDVAGVWGLLGDASVHLVGDG
jgi:hypothetical protein